MRIELLRQIKNPHVTRCHHDGVLNVRTAVRVSVSFTRAPIGNLVSENARHQLGISALRTETAASDAMTNDTDVSGGEPDLDGAHGKVALRRSRSIAKLIARYRSAARVLEANKRP